MKLKEYLEKYNIHPTDFAAAAQIPLTSIYLYIREVTVPRNKTAAKIEKASGGKVTLKDLRMMGL
jgi:predicted transcriptional regulator